jgi:hypothetical protein
VKLLYDYGLWVCGKHSLLKVRRMTDAYAHVWKTSDFPLILKLPVDNPFPSHSPFHNGMTFLKGPKHEIFESGFL